MSIPRPEYEALNRWIFGRPHLVFEGRARYADDQEVDLPAFFASVGMIVNEMLSALMSRYTITRPDGSVGRPRNPRIVFSADPRFDAVTDTEQDRVITIHLGIPLAACALPHISGFISQMLRTRRIDFDDLDAFAQNHHATTEIERLFAAWRDSADNGWTTFKLPAGAVSDWAMYRGLVQFIVAHEFAHWVASISLTSERNRLLSQANRDIEEWLTVHPDRQIVENIAHLLRRSDVRDAWCHEIAADAMGFQICMNDMGGSFGGELSLLAEVGAAMTFAFNGMLETFLEEVGMPVTGETHPSSYARFCIFNFILAKQAGLSVERFVRTHGTGTAVAALFGSLLSEYERRRGNADLETAR